MGSVEDTDGAEEEKGGAAANMLNTQQPVDIDSLPTISMEEVPKHKKREDCWTVVDGLVYDVTDYIPFHPGGKKILLGAGKESSEMFRK